MPVSLSVKDVEGRLDRRTIKRRALRLLELIGQPTAELSVVLCDDALISQLNETYRGKPNPTDVLSFSMTEGEDCDLSNNLLGDVVISLDTAQRQARSLKRTLLEEVTSLLIHGMLHLVGHDHQRAAESRKMFALSSQLEEQLSHRRPPRRPKAPQRHR